MLPVSDMAKRVKGQPMFQTLEKVQEYERQGKRIYHFEIGDPGFNTPRHIVDAACNSLRNGETHYVSSVGIPDMINTIMEVTETSRGFKPRIGQVLVTPGANIAIYLGISCLTNPTDEIIISNPCFPTYLSVAEMCQAKTVPITLSEENGFKFSPELINEAITGKTRIIILNSPNNPTGVVTPKKDIDEIYKIARDNGVYLMSDEVYARLVYGDTRFSTPSINDECSETCIVINGFSKAFAMTGWRIGTVIAPSPVIKKMGLLVQTLCSCTPPFIQRAAIAAMRGNQEDVDAMISTYKMRREYTLTELNSIPGISCYNSDGAFYVFPNISSTGMTSKEFTEFILDTAGVAVLPGTDFGSAGEGYIRMSYSGKSSEIKEGLRCMKQAMIKNADEVV